MLSVILLLSIGCAFRGAAVQAEEPSTRWGRAAAWISAEVTLLVRLCALGELRALKRENLHCW